MSIANTPLPAADVLGVIRNRTFDEIAVGDAACMERTLTAEDVQLFAMLTGQTESPPRDVPAEGAAVAHTVVPNMLGSALIGALLGNKLPGPGAKHVGQTLQFLAPVRVGDLLAVSVSVVSRDVNQHRVKLACRCVNTDGAIAISGEADVIVPTERVEVSRNALPDMRDGDGEAGLQRLLAYARSLGPIRTAVVHPCDALSLSAALDARADGLIVPRLVAPRSRLEAVAAEAGLTLNDVEIDDVPHSHAAAARAVALAAQGEVEALMKGSLHTDELMSAVLRTDAGLRTKRRVSHCFLMQTPAYPRPFILTDAAVNIAPSLDDKADILRNAIDLAHTIGVTCPHVAILAAVETVNPRMAATLDAAALCKMADRGQITGAVLDGPLAFDNAVSAAAARIKGIVSPVAGQADILVVPDLESGNMLAKQLEYLGGAISAGIVLGARVPIVLTSRADLRASRLASCAVAVLLAHRYRMVPP
ncbi:bifunctional enoyl-CoA hydratase/phosphate acetyltransferase [Ralstonia pickettii]|uniref:bifunctional enoyl-CoA hydratase/phosphate acetyltransferase n=1 Tax=Ralstonia pickettii TaxID=329 RepID=UPI0027150D22|nr:bifunctional enoyl-CoA hydratase/phosphate acetyltransferase [Ralstonia pickettii]WKZ88353.1 bifunctional enoyl-CoA hydratase/phosphate acetyltransferase [Ralstonia pickettii]